MKLAYLAPHLPSVSATFVYRELLGVERVLDTAAHCYSLHPVTDDAIAPDGRPFFDRTTVLYRNLWSTTAQAARAALRHPVRTLRALRLMGRDLVSEPGRPLRLFGQFLTGCALGRSLVENRVAHLHVHFAHAPATVGMYAGAFAGIPFSVLAHANDLYVHPQLLEAKLRRARPFLTISEENRRFLKERYGAVADAVGIQRCGVDVGAFRPGSPAPVLAPDRPPLVVSTGRLVQKKGFDLLLRALARVQAPWRFVLAGDGPERTALEDLAERLGIADRVRFLGAVDTSVIRDHLGRAHVFALPCRRAPDGDVDGIPVALMEAMAAGLAVVSTRLSGIPELIEDGVSGRLVEPEDVSGLADALEELLQRPNRNMRRAAREAVEQEFDVTRNAERLVHLFRNETPDGAQARFETRNDACEAFGAHSRARRPLGTEAARERACNAHSSSFRPATGSC